MIYIKINSKFIKGISVVILLLANGLYCDSKSQVKVKPDHLSVNFLDKTEQVFLNGYLVNTSLDEAQKRRENFQFVEIEQVKPFFGWVVNSNQNNTLQTAYRIIVSSNKDSINADKGDMWDSGKKISNESINITYQGNDLESDKVYYWKVKTWDNHGFESDYSVVSMFKTADELKDYDISRYPLQKKDEYSVSITPVSDHLTFVDFGKAAFGRLRLNLFSETGADTIIIRLGEDLKDGRINQNPGGTIRYSSYSLGLNRGWNTYIIAIKPDRRNTGSRAIKIPEYIGDITPFRYCEIEGYVRPLKIQNIIRETVFYPFDDLDSYFISSDTVLNQVWDLCKYTMKATSFAGVYVDGDRERIPYEADALINQLGHYSVAREYSLGRYTYEYLIHHATWPTEWILQSVLMAWNDYMYTGNIESLERSYRELKAKTLISLADESGFISTTKGKVTPDVLKSIHLNDNLRDIVDWPHTGILGLGKNEQGETDGFVFKDVNTVVNAYHYYALHVMSIIADHLGESEDSEHFKAQAKTLKIVFNQKLIDPARKIYIDGIGTDHASLHANMFPLAFGLAPKEDIDSINEFIRSRGMACSVYGSQFLMEAVYDSHNANYGLELLTSTAERSWYNMIRAGSTITMEAWDNKYKPNQDWNHAWGAAPANIIPRKLMGIEPLEPGFKKIQIKPQPGVLKSADIKCPTIMGDIHVSFLNEPQKSFVLNISIPANTTADVYLPNWSKMQKIFMNGKKIKARKDTDFVIVSGVGSGSNEFIVNVR